LLLVWLDARSNFTDPQVNPMLRSVCAVFARAWAEKRGARQHHPSFHPQLEHLEARELLNAAPIALNDAYTTSVNATLTVAVGAGVLANDTDPEGQVLRANLVSRPAHGKVTLKSDGSFVYTPTAGYTGTDTFTYRAGDGRKISPAATVTITVKPVNRAPAAVGDLFQVDEGKSVAGNVLANDADPDGDPLSAVLLAGPSHGNLTLNANGAFSYTPTAGYHGGDSFTYQAKDPSGAASVASVSITVNPVYDFSAVAARLEDSVSSGKLTGVSLIVLDGDEVLYEDAFGNQTLDTQLFIASATKLTSATVLMTLVDDGLIGLDDTIAQYLPQFTTSVGSITIRQLLSQTHGLPGNHRTLNAPGQDNGLTLEQCVDAIAADFASGRLTPVRPAGTEFDYSSGISYQIFGRIAELVTGQTWDQLWHERVGDPLQMTNTTYGDTDNPRLAGGMASTLADYGRLVQMFLNGGATPGGERVLSEAAVAEMLANQVEGLPFGGSPAMHTEGYGLSWWHHEMNTVLSVPGAYGAIPWIDLSKGYAAFLLTYDSLANSVPVWEDIEPLIGAELGAAPQQNFASAAAQQQSPSSVTATSLDGIVVATLADPFAPAQQSWASAPGKLTSAPQPSGYLSDSSGLKSVVETAHQAPASPVTDPVESGRVVWGDAARGRDPFADPFAGSILG
jgi:VCBS repeat-containing protein